MISCHNIIKKHRRRSFHPFSLKIDNQIFGAKGITAVLGANGSGKSTLLFLLSGLRKPDHGFVRFDGKNVFEQFESVKQQIQLLSWSVSLFEQLRGEDQIQWVRSLSKRWDSEMEAHLRDELSIPLEQPIGQLSRGEHAKLKLLLALCEKPKILLIDEITNDLDSQTRKLIYKKLDEYSFENDARVIVATNIVPEMERYATHIVVMKAGRVVINDSLDNIKLKSHSNLESYLMGIASEEAVQC